MTYPRGARDVRPSTALSVTWALVFAAGTPIQPAAGQIGTRLTPAAAYERLDSLETAALTGATFTDRLAAVQTITSIAGGQGDCVSGPPPTVRYPGLVRRLASVYRRSPDRELRSFVLYKMLWVVECDEAVDFLVSVAQESPPDLPRPVGITVDEEPASLPWHAISVLAYRGSRGEAALRRLHNEGTVRDSSARVVLEALARRGFRPPP